NRSRGGRARRRGLHQFLSALPRSRCQGRRPRCQTRIRTPAAVVPQSNAGEDRRAAVPGRDQRCADDAGVRLATLARRSMEGDPARPIVSRSDEAVSMDIPRVQITAVERRTLLGLAAAGIATTTIGAVQAGDRFWAAWLLVS